MSGTVDATLQAAFHAHQAGNLDAAAQGYERVLQAIPSQADALNLLGVIRSQRKDHQAAIELLLRAVAVKVEFVDAWLNLAKTFSSARRLREAVGACDVVTRLHPGHSEALATRARALRKLKDHAGALQAARACLEIDPDGLEMARLEAVCLTELQQFEDAQRCYERCIARHPDDLALANDHAMLLVQLKREQDAMDILERLVSLSEPFLPACSNLANLLHGRGERLRARTLHEQVISRDPRMYAGWINYANVLQKDGELAQARQALETACNLQPQRAEAYVNLAGVLMGQEQEQAALATLRKAIALEPDLPDAWNNLGAMELDCARPKMAQAAYAEAIQRSPGMAAAHFGLALSCLIQGEFERGWPLYEWRWLGASQSKPEDRPRFSCPQWKGDQGATQGTSIVVYHEQGFGDTVQFMRFVPALQGRFGQVTLVVQPALYELARCNLPSSVEVLTSEQGQRVVRERRFDWHCPMGSLPLALGLRDPAQIPQRASYLRVPSGRRAPASFEALRMQARETARPLVGICWAGNPELAHDKSRSIGLAALRGLIGARALGWVSLQKQCSEDDAALLRELGVVDPSAELLDFCDTAAIIQELDLVISVDTAIAHLTGALGRPCWLLNRFQSEWRWMHGRSDSVWYGSMRVLRQQRRNDWQGVLLQLDEALSETFGTGKS